LTNQTKLHNSPRSFVILAFVLLCVIPTRDNFAYAADSAWQGIIPEGYTAFELEYIRKGDFLRVLRTFDMEVASMEFARNILFLKFRETDARDRAIRLHPRLDAPPLRVGLHLYLIEASTSSGQNDKPLPGPIRERLAEAFSFSHYRLVDQTFLTVNTDDKGESYLAGRYKITLKPRKSEDGSVKLSGITVRDLDLNFVLQKRSEIESTDPDALSRGPDGLRKSDTRLIKTSVTVESGETIVAGS